jgi:UPF0176 protein
MQVLLFYKYVTIRDPNALADSIREQCTNQSLLGRILVAEEGINGTVEGTVENTEVFVTWLLSIPELHDMQVKRSDGDGKAFPKLKVKVREEIVGTRFPKHVDPRVRTAPHLRPDELKQWYESGEDFVVVDMRNSYEYLSGRFKNSIDPGLQNSRDLPQVLDKIVPYKNKKVLTVCTGGVRCEKMSAYLLAEGFQNVYQLDGGMHTYMEQYPGEDFEGTLYTFDGRKVMDFGGERAIVGRCAYCESPTERYVNCKKDTCNLHYLSCETCMIEDRARECVDCESGKVPVGSMSEED